MVAYQFPTTLRDIFDGFDRLHDMRIADGDFWYPYGAKEMGPLPFVGLFERSAFVRAKKAGLARFHVNP